MRHGGEGRGGGRHGQWAGAQRWACGRNASAIGHRQRSLRAAEISTLSPELPEHRPLCTTTAEVDGQLQTLLGDAALADIQYHLYVLEKVKKERSLTP
jgi:hypothetical protein